MKTAAWICLGVVVGFLLGTIPGRREVSGLERRVHALEVQLARADEAAGGGGLASPLPGLGRMLRGAERFAGRPGGGRRSRGDAAIPDGGVGALQVAAVDRGSDAPATNDAIGPDAGVPRRRTPMERFDMAVSAQRLRASQTREALREEAHLDDAKMTEVDNAVARMNSRLEQYADELVQMTMAGERPRAGDMLSLTHDVTGILAESQAELERIVGGERLQNVEESAGQIWNYVDLEKFRAAVEAYAASEGN